jgi:hypothetical protein
MNAEFSPLGALFLVVWLAAGGYAVSVFFRTPQHTTWHWLSLIIGLLMLTFGVVVGALGFYMLWRIRR